MNFSDGAGKIAKEGPEHTLELVKYGRRVGRVVDGYAPVVLAIESPTSFGVYLSIDGQKRWGAWCLGILATVAERKSRRIGLDSQRRCG